MLSPLSSHIFLLRKLLSDGVRSRDEVEAFLKLSRLTISELFDCLASEVVYFSVQEMPYYALRDQRRASFRTSVFRIDAHGLLQRLGTLEPVLPEGYVLNASEGVDRYSHGIPWWLYDICPQGFLGRIYAYQNANSQRFPQHLSDWSDLHAMKALMHHGNDLPGDLLVVGEAESHSAYIPSHQLIASADRPHAYTCMALEIEAGTLRCPWVAGEQPKFTAYAETEHGSAHVIVKFSGLVDDAASERWRDLLLAEHIALDVLTQRGVPAAQSRIVDHVGRRFLEVVRFDRIGHSGRVGLYSLAALDAEFVGTNGRWFEVSQALEQQLCVEPASTARASLLWAFGTLIGNTDMHNGNLSYLFPAWGLPGQLAPAYDMTPMAFAPNKAGEISNDLRSVNITKGVQAKVWRTALLIAKHYAQQLQSETRFSPHFTPCIHAIMAKLLEAELQIFRLPE